MPMPPAAYGRPAMRAVNSSARSPAKTRCVWLSTKPGTTQRPAASTRPSAAAPAEVTATTRPSSTTTAASWTSPSGPSPTLGSLVTSRPMRSMTSVVTRPPTRRRWSRRERSGPRPTRARRRGRSSAHRPSRGRRRAPLRRTQPLRRGARCGSGQADAVEADDGEVGQRADAKVTGVGPTERPRAPRRGRGQEIGGGVVAADPVASRSSSSTARASSNRSITACESDRGTARAGARQAPRRGDPVGQVPLGRRAEADVMRQCRGPRRRWR